MVTLFPVSYKDPVQGWETSTLHTSVSRFCRDLTRSQRAPSRICTCYFDLGDLLSGKASVGALSYAVAQVLEHQDTNANVQYQGAQGPDQQQQDPKGHGTTSYSQLSTIFITESLGSCVVKRLLSVFNYTPDNLNIVRNTRVCYSLTRLPTNKKDQQMSW